MWVTCGTFGDGKNSTVIPSGSGTQKTSEPSSPKRGCAMGSVYGRPPAAITSSYFASTSGTEKARRYQPTLNTLLYGTPTGFGSFHSTRWTVNAWMPAGSRRR